MKLSESESCIFLGRRGYKTKLCENKFHHEKLYIFDYIYPPDRYRSRLNILSIKIIYTYFKNYIKIILTHH